jgi:SAM-dependent methyltransferase
MLLLNCLCGNPHAEFKTINKIPTLKCIKCGIHRQKVNMTESEYNEYYKNDYHKRINTHEYKNDLSVAVKRLKAYGFEESQEGKSLLDIGSGNQAFVDQARLNGFEAYGVEPGSESFDCEFTYNGRFTDINFPTEEYDVITIHDVLEHIVDPKKFLKEVNRVIKPGKFIFIDIPDFWNKKGKHHWKKTEHIWMLNRKEFQSLLEECGFQVITIETPIPGKLVFKLTKPIQKRKTILLPPGIGDIYWCITKLESFLESIQEDVLDVYVSSITKGRDRSSAFIKKFPFLHMKGYLQHSLDERAFGLAYHCSGKNWFKNVCGRDYFCAYNGSLEHGMKLDEIKDYKTNWDLKMFSSLDEQRYGKKLKAGIGGYVIAYFVDHGMYERWINEYSYVEIARTLLKIYEKTGKKIVLLGAKWDHSELYKIISETLSDEILINLTGETSLDEAFSVLKFADAQVAFPSGLSMMGVHFGIPTVMIWNRFFRKEFWQNACKPDAYENWYFPMDSRNATAIEIGNFMKNMIDDLHQCD